MGLSCTCGEWEGDPDSWGFYFHEDFVKFSRKRRKRCSSCGKLIEIGADCLEFTRERGSRHEIEWNIHGDVVPLAPMYHCAECGEIYLNLHEAGFCLTPTDNMPECLAEYYKMTGFDPKKYQEAS